jgi:mono/diheme cytochrome c family protein
MRRDRSLAWIAAVSLICASVQAEAAHRYGLGRPPTAAELSAWDIDVRADGFGLPAGSGSVAEGREIFAHTCAGCHGDNGQGGHADRLAGGQGTLTFAKPVKTVGSYWPYATTLFDYIRRAMPFDAPQSLSDDEVYSVSAYVLRLNGLVAEDTTFDAKSLPRVAMPNRNGFIGIDAKPKVSGPQ